MSTHIDESSSRLPQRLLASTLVATLPDRPVRPLVGAVEVLVQERITAISLPVGQLEQVASLVRSFGMRACFLAHDVADAAQLEQVSAAGASMAVLCAPDATLVARAHELGLAVAVPALTPTEVLIAATTGADLVQVLPAEVLGASYPEQLRPLVGDVVLGARGGLGAYSARRWAEAGAKAIWLDDALLGDVEGGINLSGLRERSQTFRAAVD